MSNQVELESNPSDTETIQLTEGDNIWNKQLNVRQGSFWISIICPSQTQCEQLELTVTDSTNNSLNASGRFNFELTGNLSAGNIDIVISRFGGTNQEIVIKHIFFDTNSGEFIDSPNQIPIPGENTSEWPLIDTGGCQLITECGLINRTFIDENASWWNGTLDGPEDADALSINSSMNDLIEIGIIAHSSDILIEIWSRSENDLNLISEHQFTMGIDIPRIIVENSGGEIWVLISSYGIDFSLYSLRFAAHSASLETSFGDTPHNPWVSPSFSDITVSGHITNGDIDSIRLDAGPRSHINVDWWFSSPAEIAFKARDGSWTTIQNNSNQSGNFDFIIPSDADAAAITITSDTPIIWVLTITNHGPFDGGNHGDASDHLPTRLADTLELTIFQSEMGETTGSIGGLDIRDVYLISREEGFPYRNWFSATIEADPGSCTIKLVELNSTAYDNWYTVSWNLTEMQGQQANVGLELPHGTHLMIVESNSEKQVEYSIHWSWITPEGSEPTDEGEWIDYSKDMPSFYIIVAILLLSPWLLIAYWQLKGNNEFELEEHEKKRLVRLKERLTLANPEDSKDPHALLHALESLADTDWNYLQSEWGEPLIRHTTQTLDLVAWELKSNDKIRSMTIGVTLTDEEWTLAAIRFQAIEGSEWNVSTVTPETLFDGDEVFLGDLKAKTSRFLRVDIEGSARGFDMILSGLVGGKPVAAVPTKAVLSEEE